MEDDWGVEAIEAVEVQIWVFRRLAMKQEKRSETFSGISLWRSSPVALVVSMARDLHQFSGQIEADLLESEWSCKNYKIAEVPWGPPCMCSVSVKSPGFLWFSQISSFKELECCNFAKDSLHQASHRASRHVAGDPWCSVELLYATWLSSLGRKCQVVVGRGRRTTWLQGPFQTKTKHGSMAPRSSGTCKVDRWLGDKDVDKFLSKWRQIWTWSQVMSLHLAVTTLRDTLYRRIKDSPKLSLAIWRTTTTWARMTRTGLYWSKEV